MVQMSLWSVLALQRKQFRTKLVCRSLSRQNRMQRSYIFHGHESYHERCLTYPLTLSPFSIFSISLPAPSLLWFIYLVADLYCSIGVWTERPYSKNAATCWTELTVQEQSQVDEVEWLVASVA